MSLICKLCHMRFNDKWRFAEHVKAHLTHVEKDYFSDEVLVEKYLYSLYEDAVAKYWDSNDGN